MNASKELDRNTSGVSREGKFGIVSLRHTTARALYRRWPVVVLLLVLIQVAAPLLCADGITFNNISGIFDAKDFVSFPANVLAVSSESTLNFAVASAGYFSPFGSSQTATANTSQTSGPIAPGVGIVPIGGPSVGVTTIPTGGPSVGVTTNPTGGPSVGVTTNPTGGPSVDVTNIPMGGPSVEVTTSPAGAPLVDTPAIPEPASLWLVGIGLAILVFWSHRKRTADRHV
jgi:hypothetical protein